jgi:predicted RNase H-like nuclease (RuvC/YqgF family)
MDEQLKKLTAERDDLAKQLKELQDAPVTPDPRIAELENERDQLAEQLKELLDAPDDETAIEGRIAELEKENAALKAKFEKADRAAKTAKAARPASPRKIKALDNGLTGQDLMDAIGEAETVELTFSNGRTEILGIDPLTVSGDAWRLQAGQVLLNVSNLTVHGPAVGAPPYPLAGYGLLLDGKLAAYAARSETLTIGGGAQFNLKDDVVF